MLCERAVDSQYRTHIPLVLRDALPRYHKGENTPQGCRSSNRDSCHRLWGQTLPSLGPFSSQVGAPTLGSEPKPSGNTQPFHQAARQTAGAQKKSLPTFTRDLVPQTGAESAPTVSLRHLRSW